MSETLAHVGFSPAEEELCPILDGANRGDLGSGTCSTVFAPSAGAGSTVAQMSDTILLIPLPKWTETVRHVGQK